MASATATILRAVRAHFGLSQEQLAAWLGVTRRLVTYAERGDRALSTSALLQLNRLAALLPPPESAVVPTPASPETEGAPSLLRVPAAELASLHARLAENAYETAVIRRALNRQAVQRGTAQRQLAAIEALTRAPNYARDQLWLDLRRLAATRVLAACAPATLALQHARLVALAAEAAYLRTCLAPSPDADR